VADYSGSIGASGTSSNNSVLVIGAGSAWSNAGYVNVGGHDGSGNSLTVADGGKVSAYEIQISVGAGSNSLNIGRLGANDAAGIIDTPTIRFFEGPGAINFNQSNAMTLSAEITGNGSVNQLGTGTTELSGMSTYTGPTTVSAGTLLVNGSIANSAVTVENGGTLGGAGTVGVLTILDGGTVNPGNSPGNLGVVGDVIWNGGGNYNWQIYDTALGQGIGWDLITISGEGSNLDLSALSIGSKFNLNLWSLSGIFPDSDGDAINFDNTQSYTWTILTGDNAINGFSADHFNINVGATNGTAGFANNLGGGAFSLIVAVNNLNLVFTPNAGPAVPEPGTWAAAALLVGGAAFMRWRKRAKVS
jgi:T5SS/PEP-CTERM-associated repeat protein/autotransporter-associated beta strand protein